MSTRKPKTMIGRKKRNTRKLKLKTKNTPAQKPQGPKSKGIATRNSLESSGVTLDELNNSEEQNTLKSINPTKRHAEIGKAKQRSKLGQHTAKNPRGRSQKTQEQNPEYAALEPERRKKAKQKSPEATKRASLTAGHVPENSSPLEGIDTSSSLFPPFEDAPRESHCLEGNPDGPVASPSTHPQEPNKFAFDRDRWEELVVGRIITKRKKPENSKFEGKHASKEGLISPFFPLCCYCCFDVVLSMLLVDILPSDPRIKKTFVLGRPPEQTENSVVAQVVVALSFQCELKGFLLCTAKILPS
ncbi:hypothetical protein AOQ84DRAFT_389502 [Glonium stellatum]|uniref:Uncharacterized protein n=1 Tax=Glonium stellatum TaxID=574774 RepID=A0A8E2JSE6_9PEZI|nr:hypothetical protein AOQ84DRAFT_389502 [Glonium stellatum]